MKSFWERLTGAASLKSDIYEEIESDKRAMGQAIGVVVLSSIAAGIGMGAVGQSGLSGIIAGIISALAGWFIWAFLTYLIGAKFFPEPGTRSDLGELLRTVGFSSSPGLIRILGIIPGLTSVVFFVSSLWMFAAMVVAVRQALDYRSTWRAAGVCLTGWVVQFVLVGLVLYITRP